MLLKNKQYSNLVIIGLTSAVALSGLSQGAWFFPDTTIFPSGGSGDFDITPLGNLADTTNDVDQFSFDRPPTPFNLSWQSANGEPISFSLVDFNNDPTLPDAWISVNLDADNDDILPDSLGVTVDYSYPITIKSPGPAQSGGFGMAVSSGGATVDSTLAVYDGTLTQVVLDASYGYYTATANPTSYSPTGTAIFSGVTNSATNPFDQTGLSGQASSSSITRFDFDPGLNPDPANGIGRQVWTFDNITGGNETFIFSFDGGIPENSVATVPEPTTSLILSVFYFMAAIKRKRAGC